MRAGIPDEARGYTYFNKERVRPEMVGTPRLSGRGKRRAIQNEKRAKEAWIKVEVPALVDEDVWHRAQERLKMNQKYASRNNKRHFYLLRSLLVCSTCGYTLQGRCQKGHVYYSCVNGGKNRSPGAPRHTCSIAGQIIGPLVWGAIAELLRNPQQIVTAWETEAMTQIQRQERQQSVKAKIIDEFAAFCADAQKAIEKPTTKAKQEVPRLLVDEIVVEMMP